MATTYYNFNLPTVGGNAGDWGTLLNQNWSTLDAILNGDGSAINLDGVTIDGITLTGTTTLSGDLAVDTDTLFVDVSTNRVGVGTSAPTSTLTVSGDVRLNDTFPQILAQDTDDTSLQSISMGAGTILLSADSNNVASGSRICFSVDGTDRVRIDEGGSVLFGASTRLGGGLSGANIQVEETGGHAVDLNRADSTGSIIVFRQNDNAVGSIAVSATATSYNQTSDVRLKENITDATQGNVDALQVRQFDWKANGEHQDYGFIAQELESVAPYAVTKGDTEEDMWGVDYSKLVPMLVKEIQDLRARVQQLESA